MSSSSFSDSSSSDSSSSLSDSSSSQDSKSSSSESISESSSSSSADSKSSSSSSHSSQSWDDPCVALSGSFVSYEGKNTNTTWPKYDSDPDANFGAGGEYGSLAFNDITDNVWYESAPMQFGSKWVEAEIETARVAVAIRITGPDSQYDKGMTDFDIVASNTGDYTGEEVVLIRVRGITWSAPDQQFSYNLKNSTAYKFYRVIPWGQDTTPTWQYCRFELMEILECYDDSSSSESSNSSESSMSISSTSVASESSESLDLVALYELCRNTNISSSSSSRSESSLSGTGIGWEF
jgi:hypothetical protein